MSKILPDCMAPDGAQPCAGYTQLEEKIADISDRLKNGIRYDEEQNQYILVWTQRELDQAQKEADKLAKFFELPTIDYD